MILFCQLHNIVPNQFETYLEESYSFLCRKLSEGIQSLCLLLGGSFQVTEQRGRNQMRPRGLTAQSKQIRGVKSQVAGICVAREEKNEMAEPRNLWGGVGTPSSIWWSTNLHMRKRKRPNVGKRITEK